MGISLTKTEDTDKEEDKDCPHFGSTTFDLIKVISVLKATQLLDLKCGACVQSVFGRQEIVPEGPPDTKQYEKIWVCLKCGECSCGGIKTPISPPNHASRHAKQSGHPLAMQASSYNLWCFLCQEKNHPSNANRESRCGIRGMANLGNSCFLNSIMQNLLRMKILRDHYVNLEENVGQLSRSLKKLCIDTSPQTGFTDTLNPKSFYDCICDIAPGYKGNQQQDSHEFLIWLLDRLHDEELSARREKRNTEDVDSTNVDPTFVESVFRGQLSSTITCLVCRKSSTVFQTFSDLSLPVPSTEGYDNVGNDPSSSQVVTEVSRPVDKAPNRAEDYSVYPVTIDSCLAIFTKSEELPQSWPCENCDKTRDEKEKPRCSCLSFGKRISSSKKKEVDLDNVRKATKRFLINKAPAILIIYLKRFNILHKVHGHVAFKDTFNLGPYMDPSCNGLTYRLTGVVEHIGDIRGGHYVAYVRGGLPNENENQGHQPADDVWYCANDSIVTAVSLEKVLGCQAYILFYQKL